MPRLCLADALQLPFPPGAFDAVTVAFGIRNVACLESGLREMFRVLKPGGEAAILEFSTPRWKILRRAYQAYFHRVLPRLGAWISGSNAGQQAYRYLPESVTEFPSPDELAGRLEACGFSDVRYHFLTCGVAALHLARRPESRRGSRQRDDEQELVEDATICAKDIGEACGE